MTDKDPKDMTASELVRWVENYTDIMCRACREMGFGCDAAEVGDCEKALEFIADKIDAELAEARNESLLQGAQVWAKANGWPDFREGEDFGAWLDRCALPRPRFEDGEPVQLGDRVLAWGEDHTVERIGIEVRGGGCLLLQYIDSPEERLERPAPEVLGADGLPIKAGETVWHVINGREATVANLKPWGAECDLADDMCESVVWAYESITHTPPDTQEKIDDDALKPYCDYWGCGDSSCADCPVMIDGKRPKYRYNVHDCEIAQMLDLLRRQRRLDEVAK